MTLDEKAQTFVQQFKQRYKCLTCNATGFPDPIKGCMRCGFDDMVPLDDDPNNLDAPGEPA